MNTVRRSFTLVVLALLFGPVVVLAQDGSWESYTYTGEVQSMAEDGPYLWLATRGGVVRFTKATGERIAYTRTNSELVDNRINDLALDSSGNVWLAYSGGFAFFDRSFTLTRMTLSMPARSLVTGRDGTVWGGIGTEGKVYKWTNGKQGGVADQKVKGMNDVTNLTLDAAGRVWGKFWGGRPLGLLADTGWVLTAPDALHTGNVVISTICPDTGNAVLVGGSNCLVRYDGVTASPVLPEPMASGDPTIWFVCKDHRGRIWIVRRREIGVLDNGVWTIHNFDSLGISIYEQAFAMLIDSDDIVWLGTNQGLIAFDGTTARHYKTTVNGLLSGSSKVL